MSPMYIFRLRFTRSPQETLNLDEEKLALPTVEPSHQVLLQARDPEKSIKNSTSIVLGGKGWDQADEADRLGRFYTDVLSRTFTRLGHGADFGARAGRSFLYKGGLEYLRKLRGHPVLNDEHGLMVYEGTGISDVGFVSIQANVTRSVTVERFLVVFKTALSRPREIGERERVALEFFNASFFQPSIDSRFLLLMGGLEALIVQSHRSQEVCKLVRRLVSVVEETDEIEVNERNVLKQSVGQLQRESIREAGRRLVRETLVGRTYEGITPSDFFNRCYGIRSRLIHGEQPFPTLEEINGVFPQFQVMLSDLLSTDLLDVGPQP